MADAKLTALTHDAAPGLDSLLYTVDDPAGTPASRYSVISELLITAGILHGAGVVSVSGATTATIGKLHVCSGTTYTLALPAASGNTNKVLAVYITATGLVTLDGNASETIDGALTRIMWAGESALLLCDGSNWFKIAGKSLPMAATIFLGTTQTGIVTATLTKIALDTSALDNTGVCVDATNKRLVAKRIGVYTVSGSIPWQPVSQAGLRFITVLEASISGGAVAQITETEQGAYAANVAPTSFASTNLMLAAADYVELWGYQTSGANQSVTGGATLASGVAFISFVEIPAW